MNRKRFLIFLAVLCILGASAFILYMALGNNAQESGLISANDIDDINLYYYRAVPGLKMAEDSGLVIMVNHRLDIPGYDAKLYIDRIWYNTRNIIVFYHTDNLPGYAFLGGNLYIPSMEPVKKTAFWGTSSIGRENESGILYNDAFYSCLTLPPIRDKNNNLLAEVETLNFKPFLTIQKENGANKTETVELKSFAIDLDFSASNEEVTKIPVESEIVINDRRIAIYQADISPSVCRIYFQYLNSGRDKVIRVKGRYSTDKGESGSFDSYTDVLTQYPYHYSIEIPSYNISPDSIELAIESVYCTGTAGIAFDVKTEGYTRNKGTYKPDNHQDSIYGSDIGISRVDLSSEFVDFYIDYSESKTAQKPYTSLDLRSPSWLVKEDDDSEQANMIAVRNEDYLRYDFDKWEHGLIARPQEGITIRLSRQFWDISDIITIELDNLGYIYEVDKKIKINLND